MSLKLGFEESELYTLPVGNREGNDEKYWLQCLFEVQLSYLIVYFIVVDRLS